MLGDPEEKPLQMQIFKTPEKGDCVLSFADYFVTLKICCHIFEQENCWAWTRTSSALMGSCKGSTSLMPKSRMRKLWYLMVLEKQPFNTGERWALKWKRPSERIWSWPWPTFWIMRGRQKRAGFFLNIWSMGHSAKIGTELCQKEKFNNAILSQLFFLTIITCQTVWMINTETNIKHFHFHSLKNVIAPFIHVSMLQSNGMVDPGMNSTEIGTQNQCS